MPNRKPDIIINSVKLLFPAIYEPRNLNSGAPARYSVCFQGDNAEEVLKDSGIKPKEKYGLRYFYATSGYPPTITTVGSSRHDHENLVKAIQLADARNIKRVWLLTNLNAKIFVRIFDYDKIYYGLRYAGRGLSIEEIIIDSFEMLQKAEA